jgi:DNA-binding NarL/FixJ family response regulator
MLYLALSGRNSGRVKRTVTVLLVDDHALVRRSFRRVIEDEIGVTVVGETGNGQEAVQMAHELHPAVVLMDCVLAGSDGLFATRQIVTSCPGTAVLMCSMHSEDSWIRRAREAGARGYVLKNAVDCDLGSAIVRVAAGELLFASELNGHAARSGQKAGLSARQLEILQLIVGGKSNREIAAQLRLSAHTVAAHRANIMNLLGIKKTAELVTYAIRNGFATLP